MPRRATRPSAREDMMLGLLDRISHHPDLRRADSVLGSWESRENLRINTRECLILLDQLLKPSSTQLR